MQLDLPSVVGRNGKASMHNTINTREVLVYGIYKQDEE